MYQDANCAQGSATQARDGLPQGTSVQINCFHEVYFLYNQRTARTFPQMIVIIYIITYTYNYLIVNNVSKPNFFDFDTKVSCNDLDIAAVSRMQLPRWWE